MGGGELRQRIIEKLFFLANWLMIPFSSLEGLGPYVSLGMYQYIFVCTKRKIEMTLEKTFKPHFSSIHV